MANKIDDACPTCGELNGRHLAGCGSAPAPAPERAADRRLSETTQMALAVDRISKALAATPMNVALGALATVVGQAQYKFQSDRHKRQRNLDIFNETVVQAMNMTEQAEENAAAAKDAAQKQDPIRRLN